MTHGMVGDFARLQHAILRAWSNSPFHRDHWLRAGVPSGWVPAHPDELGRLPVVTKQDLLAAQAREAPWGGNLCVDEREIAQIHLTTGTSGIGQECYAATAADVDVMGRSWGPQYDAIGLRRGDVALLTIPASIFCAGLSALEGARLHGLVPILSGVASKELMLDLLTQHRVNYLYGIESLLLQLASLARERGLSGRWRGQLKGIQTVGMSSHLLEAARDVFAAPVFEVYGCTQAAAKIASTCRLGVEEGSNHFHDEHLFIETRDPASGAPVEEGEAEIILSTSYRQASPVIRFAMRDKVDLVPAGACACGSPHRAFRPGSLARMDSMLKIRGVNVWPQQVEQLLLAYPGVQDFRAEVRRGPDGGDELLLRVTTWPGARGERLTDALAAVVREKTMVRPRVVLEDSLDAGLGAYKVRRWQDHRKLADAPAKEDAGCR